MKWPFGTWVPFRSPMPPFVKIFAAAKPPLGTRVLFRSPPTLFHSCEMGIKMGCENAPPLRNRPLAMKSTIYCENKNHPLASYLNVINSIFLFFNRSFELHIGDKEELNQSNLPSDPSTWAKPRAPPATFSEIAMAKTRGAKSLFPSTHLRIPRESPVQAAIPEPPRPLVVPPPVEDAPMSPPSRRYQTRRSLTMAAASSLKAKKSRSAPPKKKAKVSEPIDLTEPSSEPESEPQPSQPPVKKP